MDFKDTPEEAAWRTQCSEWLEENAPAKKTHGESSTSLFNEEYDSGEFIARAKEWQAKKFDAGYAAITWPPELGGVNGTVMQQIIFGQEEAKYEVPNQPYLIGLGMVAPTIRTHGTEMQKERYLRKMQRGEEIWSQLFSEPGAGSDVASLSMSAVQDGDEWVLNGQKIWTSGAQYSDLGEIICRTDPDAPKHRGITAFIIDMKAPGTTVRPLRQMTGTASFNEVFFDDVRVPAENMLGDLNQGWGVAITTLMNERMAIGGGGGAASGGITRIIGLAKERGRENDPPIRQKVAELYCVQRVQRFNSLRTLTAISRGETPGPQGSVGKLLGTRALSQMALLATEILGPLALADTGDGLYEWNQLTLGYPGMKLAGGSDEVMKNIIGERVLGLPGEPRVDKDIPWKETPKSVAVASG